MVATAVLTLPAVGAAEWDALAPDAAVQERAVLLQCGRLKRQATKQGILYVMDGASHKVLKISLSVRKAG